MSSGRMFIEVLSRFDAPAWRLAEIDPSFIHRSADLDLIARWLGAPNPIRFKGLVRLYGVDDFWSFAPIGSSPIFDAPSAGEHPQVIELLAVLEEVEDVLRSNNEATWARIVHQSRAYCVAGDPRGIHRFLSAVGGYGKIDSLVLSDAGVPQVASTERLHLLAREGRALAEHILAGSSRLANEQRLTAGTLDKAA